MQASGARGGPLDPSAAPSATDGVREPGTPISSIPFAITQPGYYYLTRNLTAPPTGQDGISVTGDDVTLDLKGFVLAGLALNQGIVINLNNGGVSIRNGTIKGWSYGIADFGVGTTLESLVFDGDGIAVQVGQSGALRNCTISGSGYGALLGTGASIRGCTLSISGPNHVYAHDGAEVSDNTFLGSSTGAAIVAAGIDANIHDNHFFLSAGLAVNMTGSSAKVFLLNNFLSCSGVVNASGASNYYVMNGVTTVGTNWCY